MYDYKKERRQLFTEEGFKILTKVREQSIILHKAAGAFTLRALISGLSGDTFTMIAAVDYLVAAKELILVEDKELSQNAIYKRKI